jgi:hypothetical protein
MRATVGVGVGCSLTGAHFGYGDAGFGDLCAVVEPRSVVWSGRKDHEMSDETIGGARPDPSTDASKDPEDWVTGDEPMTGPQRSYLDTLAREAGEELPADLTKAEASEHIDRLQQKTGRGTSE